MIKLMTRAGGNLVRTAKVKDSTQTEKEYLVSERRLFYRQNMDSYNESTTNQMFVSEVDESVWNNHKMNRGKFFCFVCVALL